MKNVIAIFAVLCCASSNAWGTQLDWAGSPIANEIISTVVFSLVGITMAFVSFKIWDMLTPGELSKDIAHNNNIALAIVTSSMMLGVCIIVAAVLSS